MNWEAFLGLRVVGLVQVPLALSALLARRSSCGFMICADYRRGLAVRFIHIHLSFVPGENNIYENDVL